MFHLDVPGYSSDQTLDSTQGVFVLSQRAGSWHPTGAAYATGQTISLRQGWNLVAAPYPATGLYTAVIASQIQSSCSGACTVREIALQLGGSYSVYLPGNNGSLDFAAPPTSGMWILLSAPATWTPH
jgi:hypothetical protein